MPKSRIAAILLGTSRPPVARHQHYVDDKPYSRYVPCTVPPGQPDDDRRSCLGLPLSLPYEVESLEDMDARLEHIVTRLLECVKACEWSHGFRTWNSVLNM